MNHPFPAQAPLAELDAAVAAAAGDADDGVAALVASAAAAALDGWAATAAPTAAPSAAARRARSETADAAGLGALGAAVAAGAVALFGAVACAAARARRAPAKRRTAFGAFLDRQREPFAGAPAPGACRAELRSGLAVCLAPAFEAEHKEARDDDGGECQEEAFAGTRLDARADYLSGRDSLDRAVYLASSPSKHDLEAHYEGALELRSPPRRHVARPLRFALEEPEEPGESCDDVDAPPPTPPPRADGDVEPPPSTPRRFALEEPEAPPATLPRRDAREAPPARPFEAAAVDEPPAPPPPRRFVARLDAAPGRVHVGAPGS